jgi:hypothetical protein
MSDVTHEVLQDRCADPTCKMLVAEICRAYPSCKGDYRLLYYRYLRASGIKITLHDFDHLRELYSPETVARRYRELQDENPVEYAPTEETLLKRGKNEKVYRAYFKHQPIKPSLTAFL